ncbi:hypothetical protein OJ967_25835 [Peribacillus frigoritolerans]|uniref:hypothetical protein n=1 Tax=Peribacillus frigoritolerans TaxID=450367 RepID=UPI002227AD1F|nr:hypothetical protein [Peribacillus frigoritolerans]UYY98725.1 hypothetical protein OJ967_25835 [Peribacillus frigoritolerans]
MKQKTKVVFNITVANKLLIRGHRMVGVAPNKNMSGGAVFFFEYNKYIDKHIEEIIKERNKN